MKLLFPRRRFALVLLHAVPCLVAGILDVFGEPRTVLLVGGVVASCVYLYLVVAEFRRQQIALTPLTCFFLWFGLVLGPTSVYVALRFADEQALEFLIWLVPLRAVATGYVLTLLGACCLHLGLLLGLPRKGRKALDEHDESATSVELTIPALFGCVAISVVFAAFAKSLLFIGSTIGYVLSALGPAAACMYAASPRCGFRQKWVKPLVLLPVTLLLARTVGGSGSKLVVFSAAIPLLWFSMSESRRWKYLLVIGPLVAGIFVFVVAPAVTRARQEHGTSKLGAAEILDAGGRLGAEFRRDPSEYVLGSIDYVALRLFTEPIAVGYIVTRVEAEGYSNGRELAYLAWAVIPRLIWKDKPLVSRGEWFTSETGFSMNEETATTSTGMTSPGELYWNFGWIGVAMGMAFLGYLLSRLLWRLALPDPRASLVAMLPYAHVLGNFMLYQDSEAGSSLLNIVQAYIVFAVLAQIVHSVRLSQKSPYPFVAYRPQSGAASR